MEIQRQESYLEDRDKELSKDSLELSPSGRGSVLLPMGQSPNSYVCSASRGTNNMSRWSTAEGSAFLMGARNSVCHVSVLRKSGLSISRFFFNVYLFLRERQRQRQSMSGGGAEREGDIESETGSRL